MSRSPLHIAPAGTSEDPEGTHKKKLLSPPLVVPAVCTLNVGDHVPV